MVESQMERNNLTGYLMSCADAPDRRFVYSRESEEQERKHYNYFTEEIKLKNLVANRFGQISDTFILYVIGLMEWATSDTIAAMLRAYSSNYKELNIASTYASAPGKEQQAANEAVKQRLKVLVSGGFAFRRQYDVLRSDGTTHTVTLYGTDRDSQMYVAHKFNKGKMVMRPWTFAHPLNEAIATAAAAFVASVIADRGGGRLTTIKEDALKTKEMGVMILPPWIYLDHDEEKYQVIFVPGFFNQNSAYQTDLDFENAIKYKVQCIKNFMYMCASIKNQGSRKAYVVAVCESSMDMENFKKIIWQTKVLAGYGNIDRIYFTSEGAVRSVADLRDAFLKLEEMEDGELTFTYERPPFVWMK